MRTWLSRFDPWSIWRWVSAGLGPCCGTTPGRRCAYLPCPCRQSRCGLRCRAAPWIAYRACEAVAYCSRLAAAALPALLSGLAVLPRLLTWLAGLTGLPIARELACLELLAARLARAARLTLPILSARLRVGTAAETRQLVAQAR